MHVDGKHIAADVIAELSQQREAFSGPVRLGILMSEGDAASASFVRIKERVAKQLNVDVVREVVSSANTTEEALQKLGRLSSEVQGIIVQLPLPSQIDAERVIAAIPTDKDVDFINPPVAEAIDEILTRFEVPVKDKKAVVVGAGKLVGAPVAELLRNLGAKVSVITQEEGSLDELKDADIVVLGAGDPGFIKPQMLKDGVVLLDAGTSEQGGKVAGDADPACAEVASLFTPVPGGVGPIAVAMIFKNLFALIRKK